MTLMVRPSWLISIGHGTAPSDFTCSRSAVAFASAASATALASAHFLEAVLRAHG